MATLIVLSGCSSQATSAQNSNGAESTSSTATTPTTDPAAQTAKAVATAVKDVCDAVTGDQVSGAFGLTDLGPSVVNPARVDGTDEVECSWNFPAGGAKRLGIDPMGADDSPNVTISIGSFHQVSDSEGSVQAHQETARVLLDSYFSSNQNPAVGNEKTVARRLPSVARGAVQAGGTAMVAETDHIWARITVWDTAIQANWDGPLRLGAQISANLLAKGL